MAGINTHHTIHIIIRDEDGLEILDHQIVTRPDYPRPQNSWPFEEAYRIFGKIRELVQDVR